MPRPRSPRLATHLLGLAAPVPDGSLSTTRDLENYLSHLVLPWKQQDGFLICAGADDPESRRWVRGRYGEYAWIVPARRADLHAAIEERFRSRLTRDATFKLAHLEPRLSAKRVVVLGQIVSFGLLSVAAVVASAVAPHTVILVLVALLGAGFVANVSFRALLIWVGAEKVQTFALKPNEPLPLYTIMVPMYREANMVPKIVAAMNTLDYPKSRLQVMLVLEKDDHETIEAALALNLSDPFEIVRVPDGFLRTKPRACNYALNFARGEFTVIYDAEDRPEADQLRKSVAQFRACPPNTACLQARLNFYNAGRNWLTCMFTLDYSLWFDFLLPGLDRIGVPMPLGGTSNHLRTSVLHEIHGWDPFNVTEDADLGIRLSEKGYRVAVLDSTTFEEAASTLGNWTRQRSRWLKGYMQTWLVHMRDPARLLRSVGWKGFVGFQLFVGGTFASALLNPLLWAVFVASTFFDVHIFHDSEAQQIAGFSLFSLIAGNAFFTYLVMLGIIRRGWLQYAPVGLTAPLYWALISVAGYRGFLQLFHRPFYWKKRATAKPTLRPPLHECGHGCSRSCLGADGRLFHSPTARCRIFVRGLRTDKHHFIGASRIDHKPAGRGSGDPVCGGDFRFDGKRNFAGA